MRLISLLLVLMMDFAPWLLIRSLDATFLSLALSILKMLLLESKANKIEKMKSLVILLLVEAIFRGTLMQRVSLTWLNSRFCGLGLLDLLLEGINMSLLIFAGLINLIGLYYLKEKLIKKFIDLLEKLIGEICGLLKKQQKRKIIF